MGGTPPESDSSARIMRRRIVCDRHAPLNGADSEPVDLETPHRDDATCDYCGTTVFGRRLRGIRIGSSTSWQCDPCFERTQRRYAEATQ